MDTGDIVTEVDINTVPGLIAAIDNHGGMLNKIEVFDKNGNKMKFISVYPAEKLDDNDDDYENIICLDVERVD
jgi:hypothetical protein